MVLGRQHDVAHTRPLRQSNNGIGIKLYWIKLPG